MMYKTKLLLFLLTASICFNATAQNDSGLLFYLSGDRFEADVASGKPHPNYMREVSIIPDGARGGAFRCGEDQLFSYWAHGNLYAQRGTLSFYWRAGVDPFTDTEFPIFRAGYSDHSSWDMSWLRIDYNGNGFDAFVTDVNLARIRTSCPMRPLPDAMQWTHFALTWDETRGIRFYINGEKAGQRDTSVVLDAGLDQFGAHSRIISPYQVQSAYNFRRGGDLDEVRIYDRALDDAEVRRVARGEDYRPAPLFRTPGEKRWSDEWLFRHGWSEGRLPPALDSRVTAVRKVQILEAYDLKTWYWKASDGIRETTWPGVYNRSRIIGRNDYFQLPDWFCYSLSGLQVRFNMPSEMWNYLEISGGADGQIGVTPNRDGSGGRQCFVREKGRERTFHKMDAPVFGQTVVFTNSVQENPVGEFDAFYVYDGDAPEDAFRLSYTLTQESSALTNPNISGVLQYIAGRHPADERGLLTAIPGGARSVGAGGTGDDAGNAGDAASRAGRRAAAMPLAHIIIPSDFRSVGLAPVDPSSDSPPRASSAQGWYNMHGGLDGIRITLPPMNVPPVAGDLFPLNIQVKDPVWPVRSMLNFSFSMKSGEGQVLWLDLRDRFLPNDRPLHLTIAGSEGFNAGLLQRARIELVFKDRNEAKAEHVADRFTQVRDNYGFIVEERPNERRLNKYVQFENDITDLLRIDPDHKEGREYWYINNRSSGPRPPVAIAPAPAGVPLWAHLQLEYLKRYRYFVEWQIDNRQIDNGEFGGGLSDDSDFGNWMPPLAMLGVIPDKIEKSVSLMMEAIYSNDMLVNGMSKIQADGLHTYEEGVNTIGYLNLMRIGNPKEMERMMESAHSLKHHITGVNSAGHTHFRSDYFSASKVATRGVWGWTDSRVSLSTIPAMHLGELYGNETAKQNVIDLADGLLAHATATPDGQVRINFVVHFETDEHRSSSIGNSVPIFWAAWRWTGDDRYLKPLLGSMNAVTSNMLDIASLRQQATGRLGDPNSAGSYLAWQLTGDKKHLEVLYREMLENALLNEYYNTLGYVWTDRFSFRVAEIQRSRMGGILQDRLNFFAGNAVSWRFPGDGDAERTAILVPFCTPKELKLEFFNTDARPMEAQMTGWDVLNGEWELVQGIDEDGDGRTDRETVRKKVVFGREETLSLTIPSQQNVLVRMKLTGNGVNITKGRPDLAIGADDIRTTGNQLTVTVHNLGYAASPATEMALVDRTGNTVYQTAAIPAMEGVHDLLPKRVQVTLAIPSGIKCDGCRVIIDPKNTVTEIRKSNNRVQL